MAKGKARDYFTLLSLVDNTWHIEFGDYDRTTVSDELTYYVLGGTRRDHLMIIRTSDCQRNIEGTVALLNETLKANPDTSPQ